MANLLTAKTKFNSITINAYDKLFTDKHLTERKYKLNLS